VKAFYVFAITGRTPPPFTFMGHRIEFVAAGGAAAAIERLSAPPKVSEETLRAQHEIVMRISERVAAILPARFGAFVGPSELEQLMAARRETIGQALDLVRGRVQMTLRIRDRTLATRGPDVTSSAAPSTGTAYLEARRAAAVQLLPAAVPAIGAVRHLVRAERHDIDRRQGVVSMYHLIERNTVSEYQRALSAIQSPSISVSGPWPPFAFAPDLWP
jgi:hypothetical protein